MWSPFVRRSRISGQANVGRATSHISYILREEECLLWGGPDEGKSPKEIRKHWEEISLREAGLLPMDGPGRGRKDGVLQERFIIPLPNDLREDYGPEMLREVCGTIFNIIGGDMKDGIWALHRGEKSRRGDPPNLHLHIVLRPRRKSGKKVVRRPSEIPAMTRSLRKKIGVILRECGYEVEPVAEAIRRGSGEHRGPAVTAMARKGDMPRNPEVRREVVSIQGEHEGRRYLREAIEELVKQGAENHDLRSRAEAAGLRLFQEGRRATWKIGHDRRSWSLRRILGIPEREVDRLLGDEVSQEWAKSWAVTKSQAKRQARCRRKRREAVLVGVEERRQEEEWTDDERII